MSDEEQDSGETGKNICCEPATITVTTEVFVYACLCISLASVQCPRMGLRAD